MSRRGRHLAGLAPWASARPAYRLKLGGVLLPFDVLTDAALADLRARIAEDVRRERSRRSTP